MSRAKRYLSLLAVVLLILHPAFLMAETVQAEAAYQRITLTGFTRARSVLHLSSEVAGKVQQVFADLGQAIPADGVFACLDRTFIELERSANRSEQSRIHAEIAYYKKQRDRFTRLVKTSSSAQTQLDEAERSLRVFEQQLKTLRINAENLAERSQRHCLRATPGWLVMSRQIEPLQWINAGQTVASLGDFSKLLIPFALTQQEFRILQGQGSELQLHFPELKQDRSARISQVAPGFDEKSRKIQVNLELDASAQINRGGLRAELHLMLPDVSGALLIPHSAVQERYEEFWLTRASGEEIRVVYLGELQRNQSRMARVVSAQIKAGDEFVNGD